MTRKVWRKRRSRIYPYEDMEMVENNSILFGFSFFIRID